MTFYIPAIAKLIQNADSAREVFARLNSHWYVSWHGRANREEAIAVIQHVIDTYPQDPEQLVYGSELSQDVVKALTRAGFVSIFGRTWGMIGRKR